MLSEVLYNVKRLCFQKPVFDIMCVPCQKRKALEVFFCNCRKKCILPHPSFCAFFRHDSTSCAHYSNPEYVKYGRFKRGLLVKPGNTYISYINYCVFKTVHIFIALAWICCLETLQQLFAAKQKESCVDGAKRMGCELRKGNTASSELMTRAKS